MDAGIIKLQVKGGDIFAIDSKSAIFSNFIETQIIFHDKNQPAPCEGLDKDSVMFMEKFL